MSTTQCQYGLYRRVHKNQIIAIIVNQQRSSLEIDRGLYSQTALPDNGQITTYILQIQIQIAVFI